MIPSNEQAAYREAAKIIVANIYATIATASLKCEPHVSPVYFSFDHSLRLFWASATEAKHSLFIKANPSVSLVIFDSTAPERTGNGVYMDGHAHEYSGTDLDQIVEQHSARVGKKSIKSSKDYLESSPRRIYCFVPNQIWTLIEPQEIAGHLIDTKISLELAQVKKEVAQELSVLGVL